MKQPRAIDAEIRAYLRLLRGQQACRPGLPVISGTYHLTGANLAVDCHIIDLYVFVFCCN